MTEDEYEYIDSLLATIKRLNERIEFLTAKDRGEVWYWQGDEHDTLKSITCPIQIPAETLRQFSRVTLEELKIEMDRVANRAYKIGLNDLYPT